MIKKVKDFLFFPPSTILLSKQWKGFLPQKPPHKVCLHKHTLSDPDLKLYLRSRQDTINHFKYPPFFDYKPVQAGCKVYLSGPGKVS